MSAAPSRPPLVAADARLLDYEGVSPRLDAGAFLASGAQVIGQVEIGAESSVWYNTVVRGDVHSITIGRRTNLQDLVMVHVTGGTHPTVIGDRVTVGHRAIIHGCTLEDGCLIGMGAIVLDGAVVSEGAQVGAGAVVSPGTVIPAGKLALGVPARVVRDLTKDEAGYLAKASDLYVGYAVQHARELDIPGA